MNENLTRQRYYYCYLKRNIALLFIALASASYSISWAADVIDRPSLISNRASNSTLLSVTSDKNGLYAVGERGIFIVSSDGENWQQLPVPTSVSLTAINIDNNENVWVLGHSGIVLNSSDRGRSWTRVLDGKKINELLKINAEYRLKNGLPNAEKNVREAGRMTNEGPSNPVFDIKFFGESSILISGAYGILLRSDDLGKSWTSITYDVDNPAGRHIYKLVGAADSGVIYGLGESGFVIKSDDGGKTFNRIALPYEGTLLTGLSSSTNDLLVLGLRGNAFYTADKGKTWKKCEIPNAMTITSAIKSKSGGYIVSDETGKIFTSNNPCDGYARSNIPQQPSITGMAISEISSSKSLVITTDRGARILKQDQL